jgi:hypothetical protein
VNLSAGASPRETGVALIRQNNMIRYATQLNSWVCLFHYLDSYHVLPLAAARITTAIAAAVQSRRKWFGFIAVGDERRFM